MECFIEGETNTANFMPLAIRRHSTASVTPTAKTPAKPNPSSQNNVGTYFQTASTQPVVSSGTHLFNNSIQAFGGLLGKVTITGAEWWLFGIQPSSTTTGLNEASLSMLAGTGQQMSTHLGVEEM